VVEETKVCRTCGVTKEMSKFRPEVVAGRTYYRGNCRSCDNAGGREWRRNRVPPAPPAEVGTQVCRLCKEDLPLASFGPNKAARNGLKRECGKCLSDRASRWVDENPDRAFDAYLRRKFGITLERYNAMLAEQGGICAICGESPTVGNSGRWTKRRRRPADPKLVVDHDHVTGKVRGLLCGRCNTGIGFLKDDTVIVRFALKYLEERGE
jgi:hypothetical protein